MFTFKNRENTPTDIHLLEVLSCVRFFVGHLVTLTEDSAAPGSWSSRIVVQRLEEIFCDMEESMVSVV